MGEVEFGSDGDGTAGGEFGGDVAEQGGECRRSFHCVFHFVFP